MTQRTRTFSTTLKQAEGKGFEKVGDSYEGTYKGVKVVKLTDNKGQRDAHLIMLTPDEGDAFGVWANAVLADLIMQVDPEKYVRITYIGDGPKRNPKQSPAKLFKVEVAD